MQTIFTEGVQLREQLRLILECGGTLISGTLCLPTFFFMEVWLISVVLMGKGHQKKKKVLATLPHLLVEFIFLALSLLHPYTCHWVVGIQSVFADG